MNTRKPTTGEVWFAKFPFEDNSNLYKKRPVIVLGEIGDTNQIAYVSIKVTSKEQRKNDKFDTKIKYWQEANLKYESTARISKVKLLPLDNFDFRIGILNNFDYKNIRDMFIKYNTK